MTQRAVCLSYALSSILPVACYSDGETLVLPKRQDSSRRARSGSNSCEWNLFDEILRHQHLTRLGRNLPERDGNKSYGTQFATRPQTNDAQNDGAFFCFRDLCCHPVAWCLQHRTNESRFFVFVCISNAKRQPSLPNLGAIGIPDECQQQ